jgi:hypothetical protein
MQDFHDFSVQNSNKSVSMAKMGILERNKIQKQFWIVGGRLFMQSGIHVVTIFTI